MQADVYQEVGRKPFGLGAEQDGLLYAVLAEDRGQYILQPWYRINSTDRSIPAI